MKKTLGIILSVLLSGALLLPQGLLAQNKDTKQNSPSATEKKEGRENTRTPRQNLTPEQRLEQRAQRMAKGLVLDSDTAQKFIPIYVQYSKDLREVATKFPPVVKGNDAIPSEDEIKQDIENSFKRSEETLRIRKDYYAKFSKVLTQAQIRKMYSMERMDGSRLSERGRALPHVQMGAGNRNGNRPLGPVPGNRANRPSGTDKKS